MRVLQINVTYGRGSTGKIVRDLHTLLLKKGHDSFVAYGRGDKSTNRRVIKISNHISQWIDGGITRLLNMHGEANLLNTYRLIKSIKKIKPDIIHLHNIHGYYINYKMLFKFLRKTNTPVIWLLHDQWPFSGNAANYDEKNTDWLKPEFETIKKLSKKYPKHFYLGVSSAKRNYNNKKQYFDIDDLTIVTPSNWLKDIAKKTFLKDKDIIVINNGIDLDVFKPVNNIESTPKKIILGVANIWTYEKGLTFFKKLSEDLDSQKYQIILVGVTNEQAKKLPDNIQCYTQTESLEHLIELYSRADLFVNPTLEDNFPTVNIEAQACGTPVITFDTGGSGESISEKTGKVVEYNNYSELLQGVLNSSKKNQSIISETVRHTQKYSKEIMLNNYLNLYDSLIKNN